MSIDNCIQARSGDARKPSSTALPRESGREHEFTKQSQIPRNINFSERTQESQTRRVKAVSPESVGSPEPASGIVTARSVDRKSATETPVTSYQTNTQASHPDAGSSSSKTKTTKRTQEFPEHDFAKRTQAVLNCIFTKRTQDSLKT